MADTPTPECPNCRRLMAFIEELHIAYGKRIAELEARIAHLEKNSSNSHKPPSSDIVKPPPKPPHGKKRRIGGQPGHPRHERPPFPPDQIDPTRHYTLRQCPDCGGALEESSEPARVVQQVELIQKPVLVTEHRAPAFWCPRCRKFHHAALPAEVKAAGLVGPHLTALVAWLKGAAHCSYTTIPALLRDVLGVELSTGELARLVQKASAALDGAYGEVLSALPSEARLNVDETGHKEHGRNLWTWCFRAMLFTLFKISSSRGSQVLIEVLGKEFNGVLGCDCFSAYRKFMGELDVRVQFCLAHLIRDVKFLLTLDGIGLVGLPQSAGTRRHTAGPGAGRRGPTSGCV